MKYSEALEEATRLAKETDQPVGVVQSYSPHGEWRGYTVEINPNEHDGIAYPDGTEDREPFRI